MGDVVITALTVSTLLVVSAWIVMEKRQPTSALSWLLALIALPYLGLFLYLLFGRRRLRRRSARKARKRAWLRKGLPHDVQTAAGHRNEAAVKAIFERHRSLISLAMRHSEESITIGNAVSILCNASEAYPAIFRAIQDAQRYVHVAYYIVKADQAGDRLRQALIAKAEQGVEVRFLYDGVGSWHLSKAWLAPLRAAGVEVGVFLPIRFPLWPFRLRWNFRNHRKLVVVDGLIGFSGGLNIGEEYEGKGRRLGHWRDTHLRLVGPAVRGLERVFVEDWHYATGRSIEGGDFFPYPFCGGEDLVQIIPSGPDLEWRSIHLQMFLAICTAVDRCYITTPYFVPDEAIRVALISAALRGVDVRLLLPKRSDLRLVLWAGRSYYGELIRSGVRIYEYQKGFLHSKTLVVDGSCGTVGSANMDIRSFKLNFEINAFIYGTGFASQLESQFLADLADAQEITLEVMAQRPLHYRLFEAYARLTSPLL